MQFRDYDPNRDREATHRIWFETGWLEKGKEEAMDRLVQAGRALVAEIEGEAECLVLTVPGTLRHLDEDLQTSCCTTVTTSRIARKQGLAGRLAARAVALDAQEGALVAGLGMFEQGYYNRIGFGTGGYEHHISFDPAQLEIKKRARIPRRLTEKDWEILHAARLNRKRAHGACNLLPAAITHAEMMMSDKGFALGYFDGPGGALSHHLWFHSQKGEHGPYEVGWLTFTTSEQFLELMALIKNMEEQVFLVRMGEPAGIQLQDLLRQPFKHRRITSRSEFEHKMHATAYWQMRICDLPGCLRQTRLPGETARFQLHLSDPIERFLTEDLTWRGCGGDYVVTLGPESHAERGKDSTLPVLTASINAFTRMWLGVRPASGLAITDELSGSPDLLHQLDRVLRLPEPRPDWDY